MTLPFRTRHHDHEAPHERARHLWSVAMLEPLGSQDAAWLDRHLAGCRECRVERQAYEADRALLRALRSNELQPPRDLWARTAAAIEAQSRRRTAGDVGAARQRLGWPGVGALSGALVALIVIGTVWLNHLADTNLVPVVPSPAATAETVPSPLPVAAKLQWLERAADGSYDLYFANVDQVCVTPKAGCAPLQDSGRTSIHLGNVPLSLTLSPVADQLVVVSGSDAAKAGNVLVVPVPTPAGSASPGQSAAASPGATERSTVQPATPNPATPTPPRTAPPATESPAVVTPGPSGSAGSPAVTELPSIGPTPIPTPEGAIEIASGVIVVGSAAYSRDGHWLAFSARPADGSAGADLYLWEVGSPAATPITSDHATYFSGWYGDQILASRVVTDSADGAADGDLASASPDAASASPAAASASPTASDAAAPVTGHPVSFLLDPQTLTETDLAIPDVWLPVVDATGRFTVYWSGGLVSTADGTGWTLGDGQLVLDGWSLPLAAPMASGQPTGTASPPATPAAPTDAAKGHGGPAKSPSGRAVGHATALASATVSPATGSPTSSALSIGPAGTPQRLVDGPVGLFQAMFNEDGSRMAFWVADGTDVTVGHLRLVVLDPAAGRIDPSLDPLPDTPALPGFSLETGRLAWVTPPGQNGQESSVRVLAWSHDAFGEVTSVPAQQLLIVH
jgi:hypothetical protein